MEEEFGPAPSKQMKEEGMKRGTVPAEALPGVAPIRNGGRGVALRRAPGPAHVPVGPCWPGGASIDTGSPQSPPLL